MKACILELNEISQKKSELLNIVQNWEEKLLDLGQKFDLIFSRAVMELVKYPDDVYNKMARIIKEGGLALHDIELHSHDLTRDWDGHYYINNCVWKIIFGNRNYFLNRQTLSFHLSTLASNNFEILKCEQLNVNDIIQLDRNLIKNNNSSYGIFLLGRKVPNYSKY